jgi:hypothetical protein
MSRNKDVDSKATTAAPGHTWSANVVQAAARNYEYGESVERREGEEEETKEKRNLSWSGGQSGKVVAISFLGRSPDSHSANARPLSSVKNQQTTMVSVVLSSNLRPCLHREAGGW